MSTLDRVDPAKADAQFLANSTVEGLIPANDDVSIEDLFGTDGQSIDEADRSLLPWIKQRDVLFLDEDVRVIIALRTTLLGEEALRVLLERAQVSVELCATGLGPNVKPNEVRPQQAKEVLSEANIKQEDVPVIMPHKSGLFVLWKTRLPLNRPRTKLQRLSVYVAPNVVLKHHVWPKSGDLGVQYLPSMVLQPINLLQPFEIDPRFAGQQPYLSASRITKVAPAAPSQREDVQRVKTAPKRLFRAGPALFWRIRFSKTTVPPKSSSMFAAIELEVPEIWQYDVAVKSISLKLARGEVSDLGPDLPDILRPGDQFTALFQMVANSTFTSGATVVDQLDIAISAVARLAQDCNPPLNIRWSTDADFTFDSKPKLAGAIGSARSSTDQPRAVGPDSLPFSKDGNLEKPTTPSGPTSVTVSITGPEKIVVGETFSWDVFIVNRSDSTQHFGVFPISKASASKERRHYPPAIAPPRATDGYARDDRMGGGKDVYDLPISRFFEPNELTCASSNASVGPLPSSTCGSTELKFVAAVPGILPVEAVRIVDLTTRATWDITDLPDVIATLGD